MTLETFFEKFDLFADAPDAVTEMRELVLNFAVTGRLSEPQANDAPVDDLLGALSSAKKRKTAAERRRAPAYEVIQGKVERPVVVPDHWAWVSLTDIGDFSGGMTPSKAKSVFWDGDVNWFSSKDIKRDELAESELKITREGLEATGLQLYSPGCLVMVTRSGILKHTLPVSILRVEGSVNQDLKVLSPFIGGLERYLQIMLRGLNGFIIESLVKTGMTVQSLKFEEFTAQPFPLPPLAEQKRIVAKVDELMALCDRLEAQQQERDTRHAALASASLARFADAPTPANLHFLFHKSYSIPPADLRKSILTLAVQGKLVHRIPSEGRGAEILENSRIDAVSPDSLPELPAHWAWAHLGSAVTRMDSGWSPACIPEPAKEDAWGVLKTTAVQPLQYQEEQNKLLPPNLEPRPEHEVMEGDILFTRAGPMNRVGIVCVARPTRRKLMISDKIIRFHLVHGIDPDFAALAINAGYTNSFVEGLKSGMAASQVNISQPKLRSVPIPVPPHAEQRRIVAKVDQLMALVDELETQLATSRATAAKLLEALVAELTAAPLERREPSAKIIDLHSQPDFIRVTLAAEIADRLHADSHLGQTKLQKVIYLAEYIFELQEIDSHPARFIRGPHDPALIEQAEQGMKKSDWFEAEPRGSGMGKQYLPLARAGEQGQHFEKQWPGKSAALRQFIDLMKEWSTERCERFATVYAAWNDLLLWGHPVSDEAILHEVLVEWDPAKSLIPKAKWLDTLAWMRREGFVPVGYGRATKSAPQAGLFDK